MTPDKERRTLYEAIESDPVLRDIEKRQQELIRDFARIDRQVQAGKISRAEGEAEMKKIEDKIQEIRQEPSYPDWEKRYEEALDSALQNAASRRPETA